jgi:pilus assembly protein FimV
MPERAKALFAGIDLNLSPSKKESSEKASTESVASDVLRVKLNLARAYITIEDFVAAKKSLQEIIHNGGLIDPAITAEAQDLLLELSRRNN